MQVKNTLDRSELVTSILVFQEESTEITEHNKQMKVEKQILFLVSVKFFSLSFHYARFPSHLTCVRTDARMQMAQQPGAIYGTFGKSHVF